MWAGILTWLDASPARFETAAWAVFAMAAAAAAAAAIPPGVRRGWRGPALLPGAAPAGGPGGRAGRGARARRGGARRRGGAARWRPRRCSRAGFGKRGRPVGPL